MTERIMIAMALIAYYVAVGAVIYRGVLKFHSGLFAAFQDGDKRFWRILSWGVALPLAIVTTLMAIGGTRVVRCGGDLVCWFG